MNKSSSPTRKSDTEFSEDYDEEHFRRITSPESRRAADALFRATDEDLRRSYKPEKF